MTKAISRSVLNLKGANGIFFAAALLLTGAVFLSSESIRAQMANLYSESSDQVAGISSLMSATANNDIEGVKFFSKAGSAIVNQKNFGGATALHIAAREKNLEIATVLVENGADVNAADNEGWTPLMRAALVGDADFVSFLLSKNADAAALNSANESAIFQAALSDCDKCLSAMFEKYNFIKEMAPILLNQQINDSYVVAKNHENSAIQKLLGDYLERSAKMAALAEPESLDSSDFAASANGGTPNPSYKNQTSTKKFKFKGARSDKIDSVEVVEEISIQKNDQPNITSLKEQNLASKKLAYKFLGQAKDAVAVQNDHKIKSLISDQQVGSLNKQVGASTNSGIEDNSSKTKKITYKLSKEQSEATPKNTDNSQDVEATKANKIFKLKKGDK